MHTVNKCEEAKDVLAVRLFELVNLNSYLNKIYSSAYEISTAYGDGEGLYIFDSLTGSLKSYDLSEADIAFLVAQLIMIHGNHESLDGASSFLKSLNLLDELCSSKSAVSMIEYRYSMLMAIHKIQKIRRARENITGEI